MRKICPGAVFLGTFIVMLAGYSLAMDNLQMHDYEKKRLAMVKEIRQIVRETQDYIGRSQLSARTLAAMEKVPRHRFVPENLRHLAYNDSPLPIGHGQTISQPYIVALMTDLIDAQADFSVLEIGTGSGYQAAVLAELVAKVYTIEIVEPLANTAAAVLAELNYSNVKVRAGDGYKGWPEYAPFDAIVVTAGGDIPPALIEQLKPGGRMVIPVENAQGAQHLTVIAKDAQGEIQSEKILPVRFVPLIGGDQ